MDLSGSPVERPSRLTAARAAAKGVSKLADLLDELAPLDSESHPDSPEGRAWSALVGCVARATLRADAVIEAETPLKVTRTWNEGKAEISWTRPPPKPDTNGAGDEWDQWVARTSGVKSKDTNGARYR